MAYFISRNDQVRGPFSKQQVLEAIKSKKLRKTDLLGTSASGPWQTVENAVGKKRTTASIPQETVASEVQNDLGNASSGEIDFGSLPDFPAASSFPAATPFMHQKPVPRSNPAGSPASNSQLANAERELKEREAAEVAEQSNQKKTLRIVAASCLLGLAIFLPVSWVVGTNFWDAMYGNTPSQPIGVGGEKKINRKVTSANFLKIQKGMSMAQVKVLLGKPDETVNNDLLNMDILEWKSGGKEITVFFDANGVSTMAQKGLD